MWSVIDEQGRPTASGDCDSSPEAERRAIDLADKLSRFRRVTKGGW
ncbi:hypothetical protein BH09PSE1_BH09PSE1_05290 [soil metagenome]